MSTRSQTMPALPRPPRRGSVVNVYRNLHNRCWSIRADGCLYHADSLTIRDCTFKISQTSRRRVLQERCKRVHAFAVGTVCAPIVPDGTWVRIGYDPYRHPERPATFFIKATDEDIMRAEVIVFRVDGSVWAKNPVAVRFN